MKNAHKGTVTKFVEDNKPLGSTHPRDWLKNGGSLSIDYLDDGSQIWKYIKDGITVPYFPQADEVVRVSGQLDDVAKGTTISKTDRAKIDGWSFTPDDDLYLKYKDVYDSPKFFNQATGDAIYPGMNGNVHTNGFTNGNYKIDTLDKGMIIDRYGPENGNFLSPEGTSFGERALPPFMETQPYSRYEVVVPFEAKSGNIAPWFNQPGGGTQFLTDYTVEELLDLEWIRKVK